MEHRFNIGSKVCTWNTSSGLATGKSIAQEHLPLKKRIKARLVNDPVLVESNQKKAKDESKGRAFRNIVRKYDLVKLGQAIEAIVNQGMSFNQASVFYQVPRSTLMYRVHNSYPGFERREPEWTRKYSPEKLEEAVRVVLEGRMTQEESVKFYANYGVNRSVICSQIRRARKSTEVKK